MTQTLSINLQQNASCDVDAQSTEALRHGSASKEIPA